MQNRSPLNTRPWYKWLIVTCCFVMVFICLGFCSSSKGLYLSAITDALGIPRTLFSINDSFRSIAGAAVNMIFGVMLEKLGTRKVIAIGFFTLILSMLLYSVAENIAVFYVGGALLGMGLACTTTTMVSHIVNRWCPEKRGTIMGFILAANGLGGAVSAQIVTPIIYNEADLFGYRTAYRLIALVLVIVGAIILVLYREPSLTAPSAAPGKGKKRGARWEGLPFSQCIRKPYFYLAAVCIFFTGTVLQGVSGIYAAHMKDAGLDPDYVAAFASLMMVLLAGSKFFTGFLYDHKGLKTTLIICHSSAVLTMLTLASVSPTATGYGLAVLYCLLSALALPLETVMLPLIAGDLFGEKSHTRMVGMLVSINTAGYALGYPLTNIAFDLLGTYVPALWIFGAIMAVITVLFQFILRAAHRTRAEFENTAEDRSAL